MFYQIVKNLYYQGSLVFVSPLRGINSASVFDEFELLYLQLMKHSPVSSSNVTYLKPLLADLAQNFVNTPVDFGRFLWQKSHFESTKQLRRNTDILLSGLIMVPSLLFSIEPIT